MSCFLDLWPTPSTTHPLQKWSTSAPAECLRRSCSTCCATPVSTRKCTLTPTTVWVPLTISTRATTRWTTSFCCCRCVCVRPVLMNDPIHQGELNILFPSQLDPLCWVSYRVLIVLLELNCVNLVFFSSLFKTCKGFEKARYKTVLMSPSPKMKLILRLIITNDICWTCSSRLSGCRAEWRWRLAKRAWSLRTELSLTMASRLWRCHLQVRIGTVGSPLVVGRSTVGGFHLSTTVAVLAAAELPGSLVLSKIENVNHNCLH